MDSSANDRTWQHHYMFIMKRFVWCSDVYGNKYKQTQAGITCFYSSILLVAGFA